MTDNKTDFTLDKWTQTRVNFLRVSSRWERNNVECDGVIGGPAVSNEEPLLVTQNFLRAQHKSTEQASLGGAIWDGVRPANSPDILSHLVR